MPRTPREVLGVGVDATPDDIKRAYKRMASKCHPDQGGSRESWDELQRAYHLLTGRSHNRTTPIEGDGFTIDLEQLFPAMEAGIDGLGNLLRSRVASVGRGSWWGDALSQATDVFVSRSAEVAKEKIKGDLRNAKTGKARG